MHRFRRLTIAASLSLAVVSVPAMALAAPTVVTYAISGFEYAANDTVGSFAGVAVATDDYGTWQATVVHDAIPTVVGGSAFVDGGNFGLDGKVRDLAGAFAWHGGAITLLTTLTCGNQTYWVSGSLNLTAGGSGTAAFGAVLTHYRFCLWGHTITYAATVKGTVTFHLN
jgi:hypothetical protein